MTDKIIEHIKQAYIQYVATNKTYPDYNGDYLNNLIDYDLLTRYLNECSFNERFKHIQKLSQELITNESIDDFNEFIEIITDDKRFINELILIYTEHIYEYVANEFCQDTFIYEDKYARYKIEDTKDLIKIIQLIANFNEIQAEVAHPLYMDDEYDSI